HPRLLGGRAALCHGEKQHKKEKMESHHDGRQRKKVRRLTPPHLFYKKALFLQGGERSASTAQLLLNAAQ
ncbi:hypothetical protein, partial [Enterobacter hormaechei]|uniref:hypothetical protein n=1 Tax=Enterobacter hormaechei TaxID=158836 RepID=UPI0019546691